MMMMIMTTSRSTRRRRRRRRIGRTRKITKTTNRHVNGDEFVNGKKEYDDEGNEKENG